VAVNRAELTTYSTWFLPRGQSSAVATGLDRAPLTITLGEQGGQ
jgi:hypothetical protein